MEHTFRPKYLKLHHRAFVIEASMPEANMKQAPSLGASTSSDLSIATFLQLKAGFFIYVPSEHTASARP